jgi:hypothetical protein
MMGVDPEAAALFPTGADVDAVLYEFKGGAQEAIRALLHDLAALASDYEGSVLRRFVRGEMPWMPIRRSR